MKYLIVLLLSLQAFSQSIDSSILAQFKQESQAESALATTLASPAKHAMAWEAPVDPETYDLGPGDQLHALFYNKERLDLGLSVDSDGFVTLPGLERVSVCDKTLADLQRLGNARWISIYGADSLSIWVKDARLIRVHVAGIVEEAKSIDLPYQTRLASLVDHVKSVGAVSMRRVALLRASSTLSFDIARFSSTGDLTHNPLLVSGDQILLQAQGRQIRVRGPFALPADSLEFVEGDTPEILVNLLGGLLPHMSDGHFEVVRQNVQTRALVMQSFTEFDSLFTHFQLEPGDRMDYRWKETDAFFAEVQLAGEILEPGLYPIESGRTQVKDLLQRITLLESADLSALRIYREDARDPELAYYRVAGGAAALDPVELSYLKSRVTNTGGRMSAWYDGSKSATSETVLMAGDRLLIPKVSSDIEIVGAVANQGRVKYRVGWSVKRYLRSVGGLTKGARLDLLRVRSRWSDQFARVKSRYVPQPGDVIFIPYEESPSAYELFKEGLTIVSQLLTVLLVARGI
jgi:protein involved in polysaccharide export with SLBB domain